MENIDYKTVNSNYVSDVLSYDEFCEYRTIIIKSSAGTGKSHCVYNYMSAYQINESKTLICTFGKKSLGAQLQDYDKKFNKKESGYSTNHYQDNYSTFYDDFFEKNSYVCVNSLLRILDRKLENISDDFLEKLKTKVLLIDEISIFVGELCSNSTLRNSSEIYHLLNVFIKFCHKVIVMQAHISDAALHLIKNRINDGKTLYIDNKYVDKKNKLYRHSNENSFIEEMITDIKAKRYFALASDSAKFIKETVKLCKEYMTEDQKNQIKIYTQDTEKINLEDFKKNEDWFIFYSPSIITGVDFSFKTKRKQYLYTKGVLTPSLLYQQAKRIRNQDSVHVFFRKCLEKKKEPKYKDLEDCKKKLKNKNENIQKTFDFIQNTKTQEYFSELFSIYTYENSLDEIDFIGSTLQLFVEDGYKILYRQNTFNQNYTKDLKKIANEVKEIKSDDFDNWIKGEKNSYLDNIRDIMKLNYVEKEVIAERFKDLFVKNDGIKNYFGFYYKICNENYLNKKLHEYSEKNYLENIFVNKGDLLKNIFIKKLQREYNVDVFEENIKLENTEIDFKYYDELKTIMNSKKKEPIKTHRDLVQYIMGTYTSYIPKHCFNKQRTNSYAKYKFDRNIEEFKIKMDLVNLSGIQKGVLEKSLQDLINDEVDELDF